MSRASSAQLPLLMTVTPDASGGWDTVLIEAFADPAANRGFCRWRRTRCSPDPGDPVILCLAATAALLDKTPERALVFLKRYVRRCAPTATYHLLQALALAQQGKLAAARTLLVRYGLTSFPHALRAFPCGWDRGRWLSARLGDILQPDKRSARKQASAGIGRASAKPPPKPSAKSPSRAST